MGLNNEAPEYRMRKKTGPSEHPIRNGLLVLGSIVAIIVVAIPVGIFLFRWALTASF